jgi:hypothetical protein
LWSAYPDWTKEEERASGGRFDPRPVLMIHFPGEASGENRKEPFPELETHDIIQSMLKGQLESQSDLDSWLVRNLHASAKIPQP